MREKRILTTGYILVWRQNGKEYPQHRTLRPNRKDCWASWDRKPLTRAERDKLKREGLKCRPVDLMVNHGNVLTGLIPDIYKALDAVSRELGASLQVKREHIPASDNEGAKSCK